MWRMKSRALREARLGRIWTQERLAKVAGVGVRTVREYENGDPIGRIATIEFLAKALGLAPGGIARPAEDDDDPAKTTRSSPPSKSTSAPPPPAPGITQLPKASRLEELVALERKHPRPPLRGTEWGDLPPLGAKLYQDVFTAFRIHEGERAYVVARVEAQRGLTAHEAAILGTKVGVGARFHLVGEVAPEHLMGVTVHTTRVADTKRLQESLGDNARVVVRVLVVGDELVEKKIGLAFFFVPETPRPWGLVVEAVMDAEVEKKAGSVKKKAGGKRKR